MQNIASNADQDQVIQLDELEDGSNVSEEVQRLRNEVEKLQKFNLQLNEEINANKEKARTFLEKKDKQIERYKLIIAKMEKFIQTQMELSIQEISKIASLSPEEAKELEPQLPAIDQHIQ